MTENYYAVKQLLEEVTGRKAPLLDVQDLPKEAYGSIPLTQQCALFQNLPQPVHKPTVQSMEDLEQDFGYILYRSAIHGPIEEMDLLCDTVHDRALVYINGKYAGLWERDHHCDQIRLKIPAGEAVQLDILVENMGRTNYGPHMFDRKGLLSGVRLGNRFHFGWDHYCLPMDDLSGLCWQETQGWLGTPSFLKGSLFIPGTPADTFVRLDGFKKGFVVVNGFHLGRYFNTAGPQKTLYLPGPVLKQGANEIVVFETDGFDAPVITFTDTPDLG